MEESDEEIDSVDGGDNVLEAIVEDKAVKVRVTPQPVLEASVNGKTIACSVTVGGTSHGILFTLSTLSSHLYLSLSIM